VIECEATKQTRKFSWIMDRLVGTWHLGTFSWKKVKLTANQVFLLVNPNPIALSTCLWLCSQPDFCSDSQGVTWIELSLLINSSQPIIAQLIGYHVHSNSVPDLEINKSHSLRAQSSISVLTSIDEYFLVRFSNISSISNQQNEKKIKSQHFYLCLLLMLKKLLHLMHNLIFIFKKNATKNKKLLTYDFRSLIKKKNIISFWFSIYSAYQCFDIKHNCKLTSCWILSSFLKNFIIDIKVQLFSFLYNTVHKKRNNSKHTSVGWEPVSQGQDSVLNG